MTGTDVSDYEEDDLLNEMLQEQAAGGQKTNDAQSDQPPRAVKLEADADGDDAAAAAADDGDDEDADADANDDGDADADDSTSAAAKKRRRRKRKHPTDADWVRSEREQQLIAATFANKDQLLQKLAAESLRSRPTGAGAEKPARQAAWHDSDEEGLHVDDVIDYERKGAPVVRKQGKYKVYLEQQFQNTLGTPAWAALDRPVDSAASDDEAAITRTVGHIAQLPATTPLIKASVLQFKRMKDLNRASYAEGPGITGIAFHPTSSVALVTGGRSGVASIYSIDGHRNDKLHSIAFDKFSIRSCRLNAAGSEATLGGPKKFCYTYDLMTGATQRVFLPRTVTHMNRFELSGCGRLLAVKGRFGEVHVLDAASKELVATMRQENECSALQFTGDSQQLLVHSKDAAVTVFDMRRHRAVHRFNDEGCVNGSSLALSPNGRLVACGSAQGVVNVYELDAVMASANPRPLKTVFNLTTAISSTVFNHTSELLAIGSKEINDALKMVHCQTGTVYNNYPGLQGGVGKPHALAFSPQSGYLAIGNTGKEVTLYRLKHFSNY